MENIAKLVEVETVWRPYGRDFMSVWNIFPPLEYKVPAGDDAFDRTTLITLEYRAYHFEGNGTSFVTGKSKLDKVALPVSEIVDDNLDNEQIMGAMEDAISNLGYKVIDSIIPRMFY